MARTLNKANTVDYTTVMKDFLYGRVSAEPQRVTGSLVHGVLSLKLLC